MKNEEQIESLRGVADVEKYDFNRAAFNLSKHTKSACIEFLKDNEIEIDTWIEDANDNEKVRKILKIWFTLSATHNQ
jgi:hypothetical protein